MPWVPGNPPLLEEASQGESWTRETVFQVMYPGSIAVTDEMARGASLRLVVQNLYKKALREGQLPAKQKERIWSKWNAALNRLEQERGVTTLAELGVLNRVAWWRTRVPPALRSMLNTYIYHQRLSESAFPSTASTSSASTTTASSSNSTSSA